MKRHLPFLIIVLVGASAVAGGALIYRAKVAELAATTSIAAATAATESSGPRGATPPHIRGEAKARVTIEEFADFQCPPCEMLSTTLSKVKKDYGERVRIVFRNFPLTMHQHAALAARAAEAAGLQRRFWEMHDTLYRHRTTWSGRSASDVRTLFLEYARNIGLDAERFERDLENEEVKARVAADQERARALGVVATPTVFLNNYRLPNPTLAEPALRTAIEDALAGRTPSPTPAPTATPGPVIPPAIAPSIPSSPGPTP